MSSLADLERSPSKNSADSCRRAVLVVGDVRLAERLAQVMPFVWIDATDDGEDALRLIRSGAPIHVLLTRLQLPGRYHGSALARQFRALRQQAPVIYIAEAESDLPHDDLTVVVEGELLLEPFSESRMLRAVVRALEPGRWG